MPHDALVGAEVVVSQPQYHPPHMARVMQRGKIHTRRTVRETAFWMHTVAAAAHRDSETAVSKQARVADILTRRGMWVAMGSVVLKD